MPHRICMLSRGSHDFGMGHLHRCNWMHQALAGCGYELQIMLCCLPGREAEDYLSGTGIDVHYMDWQQIPGQLPQCDLLLVDWLDSDADFIKALKARCRRIVLLDDYGAATYEADLVIRSLLSDIASAHGRQGHAEVFSGIRYLQLSPDILRLRYGAQASLQALETELDDEVERLPGKVHSIMLSFGGTPRPDMINFVLKLLAELGYDGRVLVKPSDRLTEVPAGLDVELHSDVHNFHELLSACDMCVIGGGLTLYEAVFLGIPALVLPVVEHQLETARKLTAAGCCVIGSHAGQLNHNLAMGRLMELLGSPLSRGRLIHNGMRLIDGRGIYRTLDEILRLLEWQAMSC